MINRIRSLLKREYVPLNNIAISKDNLVGNYQYLAQVKNNVQIAPVLKSNAYGHGIEIVAKILDVVKPPMFCVDSLFEAYQLYRANVMTPILIMGYIHPQSLKVKKLPFSYAVFSLKQLEVISEYQEGAEIHLKVDTGMHRLGISLEDLPAFLKRLNDFKNINVSGLMSHLAVQKGSVSKFSNQQFDGFEKARKLIYSAGFKPKWFHLAASGSFLANKEKIAKVSNLVRAGLGLYGIDPTKQHKKLQPALQLTSQIVQIKKLKKGDKVGYGGTFTAEKEMILGVLPIGYNDGVDIRLSNRGIVKVKGNDCPITGQINMNITTIDLTQVYNPRVGNEAIIYSEDPSNKNSIENSAQLCDTIPYELLVHLSPTSIRRESS